MVVVPAGSFLMGSPPGEAGQVDAEAPAHRVTIPRPFAAGMHEVTFAEWDACADDGGCHGYRPSDAGWGRGGRPVINVSWNDARTYVRWLSQKTGRDYRLLSESEWEYVARAGTRTRYHTGDSIAPSHANYGESGLSRTTKTGAYAANAWGIYDVHGNVWEWVQDCGGSYSYRGAPTDGSASESGDCRARALRGGSWNAAPVLLRSANRLWNLAFDRSNYVGFRVARTLAP